MSQNSVPDMQRLINEYGNSLLRMCFLYLHDIQLAEDAVQETYIKVYRNWKKFKGDSSEKTWITRIAINTCRSQLRSSYMKNLVLSEDIAAEPSYEDKINDDTVLNAVSDLETKYREVILLFYYQELKVKEIAGILGISESAVTVRLSRARNQLKITLKGWYFDE